MININALTAAKQHFMDCFPHEGVGFVVDGRFVPQDNISLTPEENFELSRDAWIRAGMVQAVLHSHPCKPGEDPIDYPSASDMQHQIASAVPWAICVCDAERCADPVWFGDQVPMQPLVGRGFRHGVTDCYSLARDYYRLELGITLPDFPRGWEWWTTGQDLYRDGFGRAGFRVIEINEVKPGDGFLACIGSADFMRKQIPNHAGIYLGGPGEMILHHLTGKDPVDNSRLSVKEPGMRYLRYVTHWLRHEARND